MRCHVFSSLWVQCWNEHVVWEFDSPYPNIFIIRCYSEWHGRMIDLSKTCHQLFSSDCTRQGNKEHKTTCPHTKDKIMSLIPGESYLAIFECCYSSFLNKVPNLFMQVNYICTAAANILTQACCHSVRINSLNRGWHCTRRILTNSWFIFILCNPQIR